MQRPIGVTLLAIGAGLAGVLEIWRALVFMGAVNWTFVGKEVKFPDPQWGQCLAAYVVVREGEELSQDEVVDYAKQQVARFAVPRAVMFLDELPRNPTGKVMKRNLPAFETLS